MVLGPEASWQLWEKVLVVVVHGAFQNALSQCGLGRRSGGTAAADRDVAGWVPCWPLPMRPVGKSSQQLGEAGTARETAAQRAEVTGLTAIAQTPSFPGALQLPSPFPFPEGETALTQAYAFNQETNLTIGPEFQLNLKASKAKMLARCDLLSAHHPDGSRLSR